MKRRRGGRVDPEHEHVKVELVNALPTEPLSIEEVREVNAPRFEALAAVVGPALAKRAFDEFIQEIEEARMSAAGRSHANKNIRVTLLD